MERLKTWAGDLSGSVADLGVLAPLAAALVLGNGFDPATVLVGVGTLYLLAGAYFRVPIPVQPIKAAAAIAIAKDLPPATLATAGVILGAILIVLGATGASRWLARAFSETIVRGLQLGVGLILVKTALDLAAPDGRIAPIVVAAAIAGVLLIAGRVKGRYPLAFALVAAGVISTVVGSGLPQLEPGLWRPELNGQLFDASVLASAFVLLVLPQIPLTFGNAVVAVVDLEHRYFPLESKRVDARSISLSCGTANIVTGALTGMPMCHGSGGLTAHYRAGARTYRMNLMIGGCLLTLGLFFGPAALGVLGLIPVTVLAGFLAFTGLFHSSLVSSLRGRDLAIAIAMGAIGVLTTNLAISLGVGLALYWPLALLRARNGLEPAQT